MTESLEEVFPPSCHLYNASPMTRIRNELKEIGKETGPVSVEDLLNFDQMHYLGTTALDEAAKALEVNEGDRIADVGSGFGGPARYFATKYSCQVVGFELLKEMVSAARELSERAGISKEQNRFHCIDWLKFKTIQPPVEEEEEDFPSSDRFKPFDHLISTLAILHIPNRDVVFQNVFDALKPGGSCCLEDFYCLDTVSAENVHKLESIVGCPFLPTERQWKETLSKVGFTNIRFVSMTEIWTPWVQERSEDWKKNRDRHLRVHGEEIFHRMDEFYTTVAMLFNGGGLSGCRITFTRPK